MGFYHEHMSTSYILFFQCCRKTYIIITIILTPTGSVFSTLSLTRSRLRKDKKIAES